MNTQWLKKVTDLAAKVHLNNTSSKAKKAQNSLKLWKSAQEMDCRTKRV